MKAVYPTLRQIVNAHAWKRDYEKYLPISRFLFRPIGFLLTWVAIRVGLTTEAVSWLSGVVGLAGCLCLVSGYENMLPIGIGLLLFFNLLDCVDGSIARTMKTENPYGRFLDSICGGIIDLAFWGVIGIMAFRHPQYLCWPNPFGFNAVFWLATGGLTCFFCIWLWYTERTFDELLRPDWDRLQEAGRNGGGSIAAPEKVDPVTSCQAIKNSRMLIRVINTNLRVRETHYFLLLIAYWGAMVDFLLVCYLFYYLFHTVALTAIYSVRGAKIRDTLRTNQNNKFNTCQ